MRENDTFICIFCSKINVIKVTKLHAYSAIFDPPVVNIWQVFPKHTNF